MAQKSVWDKADDDYNNGDGMAVGGPAMRLQKTDKGYTYPSTPTTKAVGLAGKVGRPRDVVKSMQDDEKDRMSKTGNDAAAKVSGKVPSYKKGGMVKTTGLAKLHAGEKVIRKKDVKRTVKAVRKYGGKR